MAKTLSYIETLQQAIHKGYGCDSKHVESVPVREVFQEKLVWEGTVEIFDLINHPVKLCYAWGHATTARGNDVRILTVLGILPIDSPLKAVQASILGDRAKSFLEKRVKGNS